MLSIRWNILHQNTTIPPIELSPQAILACGNAGTCHGGNTGRVLQYAHKYGLVDESCNGYLAQDLPCSGLMANCYTCWPEGCEAVKENRRYYVGDYGEIKGETEMMQEIYSYGPIVALIGCPEDFHTWNSTEVYQDKTGDKRPAHYITIVGWGQTPAGKKYWIVMNSWGTAWNAPEGGFAKVARGIDNLGIESQGSVWGNLLP